MCLHSDQTFEREKKKWGLLLIKAKSLEVIIIIIIGHFRVHLRLHFKARLSAKSLLWKSVFIQIEIGSNYHDKNFALRLALKERFRRTRKWPIKTRFNIGLQCRHIALVAKQILKFPTNQSEFKIWWRVARDDKVSWRWLLNCINLQ